MKNDDTTKKFREMLEGALSTAKQARSEDDRRRLLTTVGQDMAKMLAPFLADIAKSSKTNKGDLKEVMQELLGTVSARQMPIDTKPITDAIELALSNVKLPEPKVTVTTPRIDIPPVKFPEEMGIHGWVELMRNGKKVGHDNPMPVQLWDGKGNPINLFENLTQILAGRGSGGATGGKADFFTIKGFSQSAFAEITNPDGRLKVELPSGSSGLTDAELRASSVPVAQASGAMWSTSVHDVFQTTIASSLFNGDDRLRVSVETGGSGLTDAELRAAHLDVQQVSGSVDSVSVISTVGLTNTELRAASVPVEQVSGSSWSTEVKSMPAVVVTSITNSTAAALVDSTGVQYSGSNPVPVTVANTPAVTVSGSVASTVVTGPTVADAVDDGSAPVQGGGIARQANPTPVAANDVVKSTHDDLGRQIVRPIQVRDLIKTAYVSVTNGTETTLLAAVAGAYLDCIAIMGSNNSDAAVSVAIRAVTAGNIVHTLMIPANSTAGWAPKVPWPQDETGNNWTIDGPDETGRTLTFSALFSQEV